MKRWVLEVGVSLSCVFSSLSEPAKLCSSFCLSRDMMVDRVITVDMNKTARHGREAGTLGDDTTIYFVDTLLKTPIMFRSLDLFELA